MCGRFPSQKELRCFETNLSKYARLDMRGPEGCNFSLEAWYCTIFRVRLKGKQREHATHSDETCETCDINWGLKIGTPIFTWPGSETCTLNGKVQGASFHKKNNL